VTAPAAAKSRTQSQPQVPVYSNNTVYGEGHVLRSDPDPRVRSEILRESTLLTSATKSFDSVLALKSFGFAGVLSLLAMLSGAS
jgi:hypothetical protein